ncbi:MAG: hypothetical protein A3F91_02140 [Flavobacteria bacterium RIFCSPLOWO2_12_FULL_35_11]|nr:MAG: hypothetical protein A3F91_02140 [Flavobacteria bacterium RIFCSPLOWO2_12_FULL_35_11]
MEKNSVSSYFIVKYADTDRMKRVYYSKYLEYFEVGRTDYLKQNYISYKKLEDKYKIYMPVVECYVKYIAPIEYEDKLKLKTTLEHFNKKKFKFLHELSVSKKLVAMGYTSHYFISGENEVITFDDFLKLISFSH